MKNFLIKFICFAFMLIAMESKAQVNLFYENFESASLNQFNSTYFQVIDDAGNLVAGTSAYGNSLNVAMTTNNAINLFGYTNITLEFDARYEIEICCDALYLEVSTDNGVSYQIVQTYLGSLFANEHYSVDLNGFKGVTALYFRFRFVSDVSNTGYFYIDNVSINAFEAMYDLDGNDYPVVQIGNQYWMGENLRTTYFPDGSVITQVVADGDWGILGDNSTDMAYCYPNNNANGEADVYGALYTWAAITNGAASTNMNPSDVQGLCPDGWHLPSEAEWYDLINYLGGQSLAGGKLKETGAISTGGLWNDPNTGATDDFSFAILPAGTRNATAGNFTDINNYAYFWTATQLDDLNGKYFTMNYFSAEALIGSVGKSTGFSVRCVKNSETLSATQLDSLALVAMYNTTNGMAWNNATNWLSGNLETWHGITLNAERRVVTIDLSQNNLVGYLPPEMGNLSALDSLNLYLNSLSGELPSQFANLSNLRSLTLWDNDFSGNFPSTLLALTNLQYLDLDGNQFSGIIPPAIGGLFNLRDMYIGNNFFSGIIPPEIGNLINLEQLGIYETQISGVIPAQIGNLTKLKGLYMYGNQLDGSIPETLYNLMNLENLVLPRNLLSGVISPSIGKLINLRQLMLWGNQLTGSIPKEIGQLSYLEFLQLGDNLLTGPLPTEMSNLTNLINLDLRNNKHDASLPAFLGTLSQLQTLNLVNNLFSGPIPPQFGNLSNLVYLDLGSNPLQTYIPAELGNLVALQRLYLANAQLSGSVPVSIGSLSSLQYLALDINQLSGNIPAELGQLASLKGLYLQNNFFEGNIPVSLGNLANLEALFLSNNLLSGSIPVELSNLSILGQMVVKNNQLSGSVPEQFNNLYNLFLLDISGNLLNQLIEFYNVPFSMDQNVGLLLNNNAFSFQDLEKNAVYLNFMEKYSPQKKVRFAVNYKIATLGSAFSLNAEELCEDTLLTANTYFSWYRNGVLISDMLNTPEYSIAAFNQADTGFYYCQMVNLVLDSLTLITDSVYVTTALAVPEMPSNVKLTPLSTSEIEIVWQDNSSAEDGFEIYRSTESGVNYVNIHTTGTDIKNYTDITLSENTTYYYQIRAFNQAGYSNFTPEQYATTLNASAAPNPPLYLTAYVISDAQIDLVWTDNSDNENGFYCYISSDGSNFTAFGSLGANATAISATGLNAVSTYYFYVCAYNAYGDNCSQTINATTAGNNTVPVAPTNFYANAKSSSTIELNWTDASNNEEGFNLYRSTDNINFSYVTTIGVNISNYDDGGLSPLTTYYYYVCAANSWGEACSETMSATTFDASMPEVINDAACQGSSGNYVYAYGTGIRWYSDPGLSNLVGTGNSYYPSAAAVGVFYFYATQDLGGFESEAAVAEFIVHPLPYADAGPDLSICETQVQIVANNPGSNTAYWSMLYGYGTISDIYNNVITFEDFYRNNASLQWIVSDANGCVNSDEVKISFKPIPEIPQIHIKGGFVFICVGDDMKSYQWYKNGNQITGESKKYYVERSYLGSNYGVQVQNTEGCFNYGQVYYKASFAEQDNISLYPIPAADKVFLSPKNEDLIVSQVRILDQYGISKKIFLFDNQLMTTVYEIPVTDLMPGYYALEISLLNGEKIFKKIIIE